MYQLVAFASGLGLIASAAGHVGLTFGIRSLRGRVGSIVCWNLYCLGPYGLLHASILCSHAPEGGLETRVHRHSPMDQIYRLFGVRLRDYELFSRGFLGFVVPKGRGSGELVRVMLWPSTRQLGALQPLFIAAWNEELIGNTREDTR